MATDFDGNNITEMTVTPLYESEVLRYLMHKIGITTQSYRDKIIQDRFNSLRLIVTHLNYNLEGFETYLLGLNKTFASLSIEGLRVDYSPVIIARLLGIIHLYNQAVNPYPQHTRYFLYQ